MKKWVAVSIVFGAWAAEAQNTVQYHSSTSAWIRQEKRARIPIRTRAVAATDYGRRTPGTRLWRQTAPGAHGDPGNLPINQR